MIDNNGQLYWPEKESLDVFIPLFNVEKIQRRPEWHCEMFKKRSIKLSFSALKLLLWKFSDPFLHLIVLLRLTNAGSFTEVFLGEFLLDISTFICTRHLSDSLDPWCLMHRHRTHSRLTRYWPQHYPVSRVTFSSMLQSTIAKLVQLKYLYDNCRHLRSSFPQIPGISCSSPPQLHNLYALISCLPWRQCSCHGDFFCFLRSEAKLLTHWHPECEDNKRGGLPSKKEGVQISWSKHPLSVLLQVYSILMPIKTLLTVSYLRNRPSHSF